MRYEPFSEDCEILGQAVLALIRCVNAENIKPYLEKHNLTQIDPKKWYSARLMTSIMSDMSEAGGAMFDFVSIGMKMAELIPDTPGESFAEKFQHSDLQNVSYRGSDIGYANSEMVGENHMKVTHRRPAPDDFLYGFLYGYAKRCLAGRRFTVKYDEEIPRRDEGGDVTIIHIAWD